MATAITSALCNIPVRHDVAMTGEITLLGRVLPIGGLKEKTMAAYRSGIKTVIIPAENVSDLDEIDATVKNSIQFKPVEKIDQVLKLALAEMPTPQKASESGGEQKQHLSVPTPMDRPSAGSPSFPQ